MRTILLYIGLVYLLPAVLPAKPGQIHFTFVAIRRSFSQRQVNSVSQDKIGFVWVANVSGLNDRYDGYSFKVIRNASVDSNSVSDNIIQALLKICRVKIWVATDHGGIRVPFPVLLSTGGFKSDNFLINQSLTQNCFCIC